MNMNSNRWKPNKFCIICDTPIKEGKMCKSCYSFISWKKKEEQQIKKHTKGKKTNKNML